MTKLTEQIWLGNSTDAAHADLRATGVSAILNCAHDLEGERGWSDGLEYAQCGLVDGPGNTMAAYHAAVIKLIALVQGGRKTLVHCHNGLSQSVFAIICVLNATDGRRGWDYWLQFIQKRVAETPGATEPKPHEEHRRAFDRLNWRLIESVLNS